MLSQEEQLSSQAKHCLMALVSLLCSLVPLESCVKIPCLSFFLSDTRIWTSCLLRPLVHSKVGVDPLVKVWMVLGLQALAWPHKVTCQ